MVQGAGRETDSKPTEKLGPLDLDVDCPPAPHEFEPMVPRWQRYLSRQVVEPLEGGVSLEEVVPRRLPWEPYTKPGSLYTLLPDHWPSDTGRILSCLSQLQGP